MKIEDVNLPAETVGKHDRNVRINILSEVERNGDPLVEAHREVCLLKDGVRVLRGNNGERNYSIAKNLSEIATRQYTIPAELGGPITVNLAQVAWVLEAASDELAAEQED